MPVRVDPRPGEIDTRDRDAGTPGRFCHNERVPTPFPIQPRRPGSWVYLSRDIKFMEIFSLKKSWNNWICLENKENANKKVRVEIRKMADLRVSFPTSSSALLPFARKIRSPRASRAPSPTIRPGDLSFSLPLITPSVVRKYLQKIVFCFRSRVCACLLFNFSYREIKFRKIFHGTGKSPGKELGKDSFFPFISLLPVPLRVIIIIVYFCFQMQILLSRRHCEYFRRLLSEPCSLPSEGYGTSSVRKFIRAN